MSSDTDVALSIPLTQVAEMGKTAEKEAKIASLGARIAAARRDRFTQTSLARELGITRSSVSQWESGDTEPTPEKLRSVAILTGVDYDWLATGRGESGGRNHNATLPPRKSTDDDINSSNARLGGAVSLTKKIPVYGQAMGGRHGEFILNGNKVADILAPASLDGVEGAYAVYVAGSSMEPRYFAGEVAFIHPRLTIKKGDFIVAQIATAEGQAPLAFIKRFISFDENRLKLEQLNPRKFLQFPKKQVVSVHLILMSGRA